MTNEQDSIYAGPLTDGLVQSNSGLQTMYRWNRLGGKWDIFKNKHKIAICILKENQAGKHLVIRFL
jgi:hypothetical protein